MSLDQTLLKSLFLALSRFACVLPRAIAMKLGTLFADLIYNLYLLTPHRQHIYRNIDLTLPELSDREKWRLSRTHIRRLTRSIVDLMRFPVLTPEVEREILTIQGAEHFQAAYEKGRGVILVSAHYGCWELLGAAIARLGSRLHVLVQRPTTPAFDELFNEYRQLVHVQTHYNTNVMSLRHVFRALKAGEVTGFLIDQHGESEDMFGMFFGKRVSVPGGPAFFSLKSGAPIVPVFIRRLPDDRHLVRFHPALEVIDSSIDAGETEKEKQSQIAQNLTQQAYDLIEQVIRENPDDWLWTYNRWDKLKV